MRFREFGMQVEEWLRENLRSNVEVSPLEGESSCGDPTDEDSEYLVALTFRVEQEGYVIEEMWDLEELYEQCQEIGWFLLKNRLNRALQEASMHNRPRTTAEYADALTGEDRELFLRLCEKRAQLAAERQLSAFIVLPNRTVGELVTRRPKNAEEFLDVPGIGPQKAAQYGEAFLQVIREFSEEDDSR